jgi:asparagine synthase (glutamine-hydrolysing)
VLAGIGSDMGFRANDGPLRARARYLFHRATFKLDYIYNEGLPGWLSPLDPVFSRVGFDMGILGLHKYLHYRRWFRRELADYLREALLEAQTGESVFWNRDSLKRMVEDHINGRSNHVGEINALLTLTALEQTLLRGHAQNGRMSRAAQVPELSVAVTNPG